MRMTSLPVFRQTFGYARLVFQTNLRDSESIADPLYFPKLEKCSLNSQHNKDGDEDGGSSGGGRRGRVLRKRASVGILIPYLF